MRKIRYLVAGRFSCKDYSKPGFDSPWDARGYAERKGWSEIEVLCEGPVEQPAE